MTVHRIVRVAAGVMEQIGFSSVVQRADRFARAVAERFSRLTGSRVVSRIFHDVLPPRLRELRWPEQEEILWRYWEATQREFIVASHWEKRATWAANVARAIEAEEGGQYLLYRGSRPIGALAVQTLRERDSRMGYLIFMYVDPSCRRRGYGDYLVKQAEGYFRRREISRVQIIATPANQPALALYQGHGYKITRRFGDSDNERVLLEKSLTNG